MAASPPAPALCAVCLCDIAPEQRSVLVECAHAFCGACIAAWAARGSRNCPLCRAAFSGWHYDICADDVYRTRTLSPPRRDAAQLLAAAPAPDGANEVRVPQRPDTVDVCCTVFARTR